MPPLPVPKSSTCTPFLVEMGSSDKKTRTSGPGGVAKSSSSRSCKLPLLNSSKIALPEMEYPPSTKTAVLDWTTVCAWILVNKKENKTIRDSCNFMVD